MIVAQMAMEAGEFEDARKAIASVLRNEPREGAFMLMADIEDAETGDQGKVREWLARAVRAPRDPAWTADGIVSEKWRRSRRSRGRLDAFEWKVPVERLGPVLENDLDPMVPGIPVSRVEASAASKPAEPAAPPIAPVLIEEPKDEPVAEAPETEAEKAEVIEAEIVEEPEIPAESEPEAAAQADEETPAEPPAAVEPEAEPAAVTNGDASDEADLKSAKTEDEEAEDGRLPPVPDDPGVDADAPQEETKRRFRLF
jgi:HemY protein